MLIGITGLKGSGKDTLGTILHVSRDYRVTWFAEPIKESLKVALRMSHDQLYGSQALKEQVDPRYGICPRHAMQTFGTEWGRGLINPEVWVICCMDKIDSSPQQSWVIPDVRFANEARAITSRGGKIIEVIRPCARNKDRHPSENGGSRFTPQITIYNTGGVQDLRNLIHREFDRMVTHRGRQVYYTT